MPRPEADSSRDKHSTVVDQFASGLADSVSAPITGAAELFGGPRQIPAQAPGLRNSGTGDSTSTAHSAGEMLGSALVFVATTAAIRRFLPGAGRLTPVFAGAALGGLTETPNNSIAERLTGAALGAGTVSLLEFAPAGLNKIGLKSTLGQIGVSGAAAGIFHAQADSLFKTGHTASLADTVMSGATWAGTGMAFSAGGKLLAPRQLTNAEAQQKATVEYNSHYTELPGLQVGMPAKPESTINVAAGSELAQTYNIAKQSVGRAEVLAYGPQGGLEGRFGTVFSVSNDGKLVTANHVVDGAVDTTVFDSNMRAHQATVVSQNKSADLAVLQLKDPASFKAFPPLPLGTGSTEGSVYAAYGHPNGWRELYVAPGQPMTSPRPNMSQHYQMHGVEGLSGAPIVADGAVQAVFIQGARSNRFDAIGTPIKHAEYLIDKITQQPAANDAIFAGKPQLNLQMIRSFMIGDSSAATANLERMFGSKFTSERPAEFFHAKVKTVPMPGTESGDLTMKMQYLPAEQQVVIRPIAVDGKPIPQDLKWPGSKLNIASSRLEVRLSPEGKPLSMVSYDDPVLTLQQGFNYRGTAAENYLAGLQQTKIPKWMQLLPPHLRFERLTRSGS
jgi:S1-C subfamily serine protease